MGSLDSEVWYEKNRCGHRSFAFLAAARRMTAAAVAATRVRRKIAASGIQRAGFAAIFVITPLLATLP